MSGRQDLDSDRIGPSAPATGRTDFTQALAWDSRRRRRSRAARAFLDPETFRMPARISGRLSPTSCAVRSAVQ
jgi:hypothetical protein